MNSVLHLLDHSQPQISSLSPRLKVEQSGLRQSVLTAAAKVASRAAPAAPWYTHDITYPPHENDDNEISINDSKETDNHKNLLSERYKLQNSIRDLLPGEKVSKCGRVSHIKGGGVPVLISPKFGKAHFGNLIICGLGWVCPVCAAKISQRRKSEVELAMERHKNNGGSVALMTLTVPHSREDDLQDLLDRFNGSNRKGAKRTGAKPRLRAGKPWEKIKKKFGIIGEIQSFEVTHGEANGWHPHVHILIFFEGSELTETKTEELRDRIYQRWKTMAVKEGFAEPSVEHGVDIRGGEFAAQYVAKWGLGDELTKGHIKKGLQTGRTPFDLARAFREGDNRAGKLFQEYAKVFKGRHQLYWSNGLKNKFEIGELTDDELAKIQEEDAILSGWIGHEDWQKIVRRELRSEVLFLAVQDWNLVEDLLESLRFEIYDRVSLRS